MSKEKREPITSDIADPVIPALIINTSGATSVDNLGIGQQIKLNLSDSHKNFSSGLELLKILQSRKNKGYFYVCLTNEDRLNFSPSDTCLYAKVKFFGQVNSIVKSEEIKWIMLIFNGQDRCRLVEEPCWKNDLYGIANVKFIRDKSKKDFNDDEKAQIFSLKDRIDKSMATLSRWGRSSNLQKGFWNNHIFDLEPGELSDQIIASTGAFSEDIDVTFYQLDPCIRLQVVVNRLEPLVQRMIDEIKNEIHEAEKAKQNQKLIQALGSASANGYGDLVKRFDEVKSFMYPEMIRIVQSNLEKCRGMGPTSESYQNNVQFILDIPWGKCVPEARDPLNIISEQLDRDHYGMLDAKRKILQYLAVKKMNPKGQNSVLCLMGPPGTGKTSFFQSLGKALNRPLVKFALGGVHDESDIRGHRLTFIGAMAGRIAQLVQQSGVMNPVFVLDEIDKLGEFGSQGNPAAALLEVLDPEQNSKFIDKYIGGPIDLSQVLFVVTGNDIKGINPILRDRLHIVEIKGYTPAEKFVIAKNYLIPRAVKNNGIDDFIEFSDEAIQKIINSHIFEEGVRGIDHCINDICAEYVLRFVSQNHFKPTKIGVVEVEEILADSNSSKIGKCKIGFGADIEQNVTS